MIARFGTEMSSSTDNPRCDTCTGDARANDRRSRVVTPRATPLARAEFDSGRRLATKMIEKLFKSLFIGGVERFAIDSARAVDRVK